MSTSYRDENDSLRARNEQLERAVVERDRRIAELERKLGDNDAVFERLRGVIDAKPPPEGRALLDRLGTFKSGVGVTVLTIAAIAVPSMLVVSSKKIPTASAAEPSSPPANELPSLPNRLPPGPAHEVVPPIDGANLCSRLGIRLTVGGSDAEAPARGARDGAGTKHDREGKRAVYFTVNGFGGGEETGDLYIHGWGGAMPTEIGTSKLALLSIMTKGDSGGYTLARDGRAVLEVLGTDGKNAWGRFEADMSRVTDVTQTPPFGTPVVRVRGNFCLPFRPGDPTDTGP